MSEPSKEVKNCCPVCDSKADPVGIKLGSHEIYCCPHCSFRFAPSALNLKVDYSAIYETAEYEESQVKIIKGIDDPAEFGNIITYRPFFRSVKRKSGEKLLDVGCGVGRFCHAAHVRHWKVAGIDISERAVAIGSRYAKFPLRAMKLEEAVKRGERYDVVTAFEVIEHLSAPKDFIRLLVNAATARGQVFCTVPNWECHTVQTAARPDWIPPVHIGFFTRRTLRRLGESTGCRIVRTGVIYTDPLPSSFFHLAGWVLRRVRRIRRAPLGLWLHLIK